MLHHSPLGRDLGYARSYDPDLLYPIKRSLGRDAIGVPRPLPFTGDDVWTAYELSWLDCRGKPGVAVAELRIAADSDYLIESKSLKLYLNSLSATRFTDVAAVHRLIERDLSGAAARPVQVRLYLPEHDTEPLAAAPLQGTCIDGLTVKIETYHVDPDTLCATGHVVDETLYSHLFRSNCPVTGQPDWASVMVHYRGPRMSHSGLLRYLVSYREHAALHEQCVERIFMDILAHCRPNALSVYARFTRRGGL
ncbi:MAG: NADPH-dependent 7-cyano-7-deazaguanine reductase QueF, partial [Deltaproteobacteria bacterium]